VPILYIEMDGTGIPVVKAETEGRTGKVDGQPAYTREVKVGCVFTQTTTDKDGHPVRDEDSTSYVAAIETADAPCTPEETTIALPRRDHGGQRQVRRCDFCHAPLPAFTRLRTRRGWGFG